MREIQIKDLDRGLIDFPADPGCVEPAADKENPRCNDGEDNDLDGLIDWDGGASAGVPPGRRTAPDPQCRAAWRDREGADYCGLGAEMAFLLPALMWWRRKRRLG